MCLNDKTFHCSSLTQFCESLRKLFFYVDVVNIVLALLILFVFLQKIYCNIMSIRDVNLCVNLNEETKPKKRKRKPSYTYV